MSAGPCPKCGHRDTAYIMLLPQGYFNCYNCGNTWGPAFNTPKIEQPPPSPIPAKSPKPGSNDSCKNCGRDCPNRGANSNMACHEWYPQQTVGA